MDFFVAHIQVIAPIVWVLVALALILRYFKISFFSRVPWWGLAILVLCLHVGYTTFLSFGQYYMWSSSEFTQSFLTQPLAEDVQFPLLLEWTRPWFSGPLGYFGFYVIGRFVLSLAFLIAFTTAVLGLLMLRRKYRPHNFQEGDIIALTLAVLVSGWPGVIVLIPLGFIIAILISVGGKVLYGIERIYLPPAFLLASPIAFIFGIKILTVLHLYPLLKL